ncbi:hypothetical protein CK203_056927 [Vitis vinifera]|uniref:Uncharacterized protein n=1 Tax=Vitis vinifera TaxID=29760 RepID=A0A438FUK3_VITVI|nr:hypothetical protein CK203_056927 [Vitis vinifera]
MAKTRGAHVSPSAPIQGQELHLRDSTSEAPQASTIPPSEVECHLALLSGTERRHPLHLGQALRPKNQFIALLQRKPEFQAQRVICTSTAAYYENSSFWMTPEVIIRRPMVTQPPIEGNLDFEPGIPL